MIFTSRLRRTTAVFSVVCTRESSVPCTSGSIPTAAVAALNWLVKTSKTAVVLRNRLVKIIHAAEPPAPVGDGRVHARASGAPVAATFGSVMPGLTVLLDAELQQMKATQQDTSVPSASRAALSKAIAADTQIEALVNQYWPPVIGD